MTDLSDSARRARTGGHEPLPEGWSVATLEESDLDDVLAIEAASFSNPWTRDMFLRELANVGVSYGYVLQDARAARLAAFCTIWVVVDEIHINNLAVGPGLARSGAGPGAAGVHPPALGGSGRRTGHARGAAVERGRHQALYEAGVQRGRRSARDYYTNPVEDALILWRERGGRAGPSEGG